MQSSGLSLHRLQQRLRQRGVPLSIATLSYWQSGERRPGRRTSLNAIRHLEHVLRLRPGQLVTALYPQHPESDAALAEMLSGFHPTWEQTLTHLSHHETLQVGMPQRRLHTRQVLQATVDGPDRLLLIHEAGAAITATEHCRVGLTSDAAGYFVAELLFDRALSNGDTIVLDYTLTWDDSSAHYRRRLRHPVRELVMQVQFSDRSAECFGIPGEKKLFVDNWHTAHRVVLNARPGIHGFHWSS